ncbi:uncharacterized mitochondrial protein AtMg00310-like [Cornus florida]|uniref:uncharacterized mitochondrial protein AtMg00310-like n=1 Tax=Cornus florida TaxID=4283 RepID=UPI00289F98E0|nr:uncharacterized mitochondrial protein AtMg00310-like [Cornus florida]
MELLKDGTEEKLQAALASMGPFKASGPDGFTPMFFQSNWGRDPEVRRDKAVLNRYVSLTGRSKVGALNFIQERVSKKIASLKGTLLSVLSALPMYSMQCFKLPKKNYEKLTSTFSNFWWSGMEKSHKIKWISWDNLCKSKNSGGLDFKNIEVINLALLAKITWQMEVGDDSLLCRSFKQKYLKHCNFVEMPNRQSAL